MSERSFPPARLTLPPDELQRSFNSLKCVSRAEYYNTNSVARELAVARKRLKRFDALLKRRTYHRSSHRYACPRNALECQWCGQPYYGVWVISHAPECTGNPPPYAYDQLRRPGHYDGALPAPNTVLPLEALDDDHAERQAWREAMTPDVDADRRKYDVASNIRRHPETLEWIDLADFTSL